MKLIEYLRGGGRRWSQDSPDARYNPWFLAWIGLVGVFLSVNIIFVGFAVSSNPGLVAEDYYERGREYEQNAIKLHDSRKALNWTTRFETPVRIIRGVDEMFRFGVVNAVGRPIPNAQVSIYAYRPSDAGADFVAELDQVAAGIYQGRLRFELPGIWDVTVRVGQDKLLYQESHRIRVEVP